MTSPSGSDPAERVRAFIKQWRLEVERTAETQTSTVVFGRRGNEPVVLKVSRDQGDEWKGGEVLDFLDGNGTVRVYEYAPGAVLLERLSPGTPLVELVRQGQDEAATEVLADSMEAMGAASGRSNPPSLPTVADWGAGFNRYAMALKCYVKSGSALPEDLVTQAADVFSRLERTQSRPRLLHGDLQHYNILRDQQRGWLAIDPKGVIGELEYELGASLRNPVERPDWFASQDRVERRVGQFEARLGIDPQRTLAWAFAQGALSAIWSLEDGGQVTPAHAGLALAQVIRPMLSHPG